MVLAEYMEKADYDEVITEGDILMFTLDGKVTKLNAEVNSVNRMAGIATGVETLGLALGGDSLQPNQRIPVALSGSIYLNTGNLDIQVGDLVAVDNNGNLFISGELTKSVLGKAIKHSAEGKTYILVK